ncbi:hypothetical protein [Dysgonomonas reticulitermitis]
MKIKLSEITYSYLIDKILDTEKKIKDKIKQISNINGWISLEIDDNDADKIRDLALDKLQVVGYDVNYE